jgi:tetratricopeptide (TPR) repeat protein
MSHANLSSMLQQAIQFHQDGRLDHAEALYAEILTTMPDHFEATYFFGILQSQRGRNLEALNYFRAALRVRPVHIGAFVSLGIVLARLDRFDEALMSYDKALAIKPDFVEAHFYRANTLQHLNRPKEALASYDKALTHDPDHVPALFHRGKVLQNLNRPEDALANYNRALACNPAFVEALFARGNVLQHLNLPDEALASYDKARTLRPDFIDIHNSRGNVLRKQGKLTEARASYRRALQLNPSYTELYYDIGIIEGGGVRSLHLGTPIAQSRMQIDQPFKLVRPYERGLMAFLLFKPRPREVVSIGLGGGAIPKFVRHYLPEIRTRVLEINPQVISVARSHFQLPEDDAQLQVMVGDGAQFLHEHPATADVLILDVYDGMGVPDGLYSQHFFDSCRRALAADGLLLVHLWSTDRTSKPICGALS